VTLRQVLLVREALRVVGMAPLSALKLTATSTDRWIHSAKDRCLGHHYVVTVCTRIVTGCLRLRADVRTRVAAGAGDRRSS